MTINQISVFLENKYGTLNQVLGLLAGAEIGVIAATVADTQEFGIMRLIVSEPRRAYAVLKENNVSVHLNDVFAIALDRNYAGTFRDTTELLTKGGLNIEYMYSFACGGKLVLVLRTNNTEGTRDVVRRNGLNYLTENDLSKL